MIQAPAKILFVDDEPHVLAGLRRLLRGQKDRWDMSFKEGGAQALELLASQPHDVVVSDMRMPGMDGVEFLSRVATEHPHTVRLMLSGQAEREHMLRAMGPVHQFLSKPCPADLLVRTIEATQSLQRCLHSPELRLIAARLRSLPSIPSVYALLLEEMHKPEPNLRQIAGLISQDLGMSALILKLVSSSFFGLPTHITTVEHAVALLGLNTLHGLVLTAHVFACYLDHPLPGVSLESMMRHSLAVGEMARAIARSANRTPAEADNAYLAGLMHDLGKLVLSANLPEYAQIVRCAGRSEQPLFLAEGDSLGASHAEVGGYLLGLWGLPSEIVEAVAYHHAPQNSARGEFSPLTAVYAANLILHREAGANASRPLPPIDWDYLKSVGVAEQWHAWEKLSHTR